MSRFFGFATLTVSLSLATIAFAQQQNQMTREQWNEYVRARKENVQRQQKALQNDFKSRFEARYPELQPKQQTR